MSPPRPRQREGLSGVSWRSQRTPGKGIKHLLFLMDAEPSWVTWFSAANGSLKTSLPQALDGRTGNIPTTVDGQTMILGNLGGGREVTLGEALHCKLVQSEENSLCLLSQAIAKVTSLLSQKFPGLLNKLHGHPPHQGILQMEKSGSEGSQVTASGCSVCTNRGLRFGKHAGEVWRQQTAGASSRRELCLTSGFVGSA